MNPWRFVTGIIMIICAIYSLFREMDSWVSGGGKIDKLGYMNYVEDIRCKQSIVPVCEKVDNFMKENPKLFEKEVKKDGK